MLVVIAGWTAASVAIVVSSVLIADRSFHRRFEREAGAAIARAGRQGAAVVTEEDLRAVPEPIARWIRWSGAVGKRGVSFVHVVHGGRFKSEAARPWMPIRGEYVVTTKIPSFHWYGRMRIAPGVNVVAIDSYLDGHGRMLVRALSAFPIADARSPETASPAAAAAPRARPTPRDHRAHERHGAPDAGPDLDRRARAVVPARAALHAAVAVGERRLPVPHREHPVGADLDAPFAAGASLRLEPQRRHAREVPQAPLHAITLCAASSATAIAAARTWTGSE